MESWNHNRIPRFFLQEKAVEANKQREEKRENPIMIRESKAMTRI
jgi:hypothetical protein